MKIFAQRMSDKMVLYWGKDPALESRKTEEVTSFTRVINQVVHCVWTCENCGQYIAPLGLQGHKLTEEIEERKVQTKLVNYLRILINTKYLLSSH